MQPSAADFCEKYDARATACEHVPLFSRSILGVIFVFHIVLKN